MFVKDISIINEAMSKEIEGEKHIPEKIKENQEKEKKYLIK